MNGVLFCGMRSWRLAVASGCNDRAAITAVAFTVCTCKKGEPVAELCMDYGLRYAWRRGLKNMV